MLLCFRTETSREQGAGQAGDVPQAPSERSATVRASLAQGRAVRAGCDQARLSRKRSAKDVRLGGAGQVNQPFPPRARHCVVGEGWRNLWLNITWGWDEFGLRPAPQCGMGGCREDLRSSEGRTASSRMDLLPATNFSSNSGCCC